MDPADDDVSDWDRTKCTVYKLSVKRIDQLNEE